MPTDRMEVVDVWVVPNTGGAHSFELHSDGGLFPRFPGVFSYPGLVNTGHEVDTWPVRHFKRMVVLSYSAPQTAAVSRAPGGHRRARGLDSLSFLPWPAAGSRPRGSPG